MGRPAYYPKWHFNRPKVTHGAPCAPYVTSIGYSVFFLMHDNAKPHTSYSWYFREHALNGNNIVQGVISILT